MDDERLDDEKINNEDSDSASDEPVAFDEVSFQDQPKPGRTSLIWRVLALGVALIIIIVLAYPFIQQQLQNQDVSTSTSPVGQTEAPVLEEAGSPEELFELGKDHYKQNQYAQAVAAFQKVIELDPTYQAAYANLGATYHRQNNLDLAVAQYQKALELNPDDGEVVYNLAAVYIQQAVQGSRPDPELMNQAIEQLNRALELSPNSAEPYFGLGVAYAALNQPEEAIMAFESFLKNDTGDDPRAREEAERYLQLLRGQ
jgi:tetratricopeptide (TPR) repeat protein